jgi:hypothetical protein
MVWASEHFQNVRFCSAAMQSASQILAKNALKRPDITEHFRTCSNIVRFVRLSNHRTFSPALYRAGGLFVGPLGGRTKGDCVRNARHLPTPRSFAAGAYWSLPDHSMVRFWERSRSARRSDWLRPSVTAATTLFFSNFLIPRKVELTGDVESNLGSQIWRYRPRRCRLADHPRVTQRPLEDIGERHQPSA